MARTGRPGPVNGGGEWEGTAIPEDLKCCSIQDQPSSHSPLLPAHRVDVGHRMGMVVFVWHAVGARPGGRRVVALDGLEQSVSVNSYPGVGKVETHTG